MQQEEQNVVMFTFEGNVKQVSQAGVLWAMQNLVKRGDILAIVSVISSVHEQRVKIRASTNQKLMTEKEEMQMWKRFPGLANRCTKEGVKLVVMEKAGELELTICREAMKLHVRHVVLDKSLKGNRRREFYRLNFSCGVTRMRKSGGVDVIRPSVDEMQLPTSSKPTLGFPRYGDEVEEFEISLNGLESKRRSSTTSVKSTPPLPLLKRSKGLRFKELQGLRSFATAEERSSSIGMLTAGRLSSESSVNRASVSSHPNGGDDDDLFGVVHGSARHMEIDTNPCSLGYESDDLFSIGTGSTRHSEIDSDLLSSTNFFSPDYEDDNNLFSIGTSSALP